MRVGRKITLAATVAVSLSVAIGLLVQYLVITDQGVSMTRAAMRAAVLEAENVRASVSQLVERGAFDRPKLVAEFKASGDLHSSTIYRTIPVVAAWEAIREVAVKEGYEFRVPKVGARNPKNNPDAEELRILSILEKGGAEDYFEVNRSQGRIIYARPIRLGKDCLACHGDPATSPTGDGKDILGFRMEGWKAGEIHGAFLLKADIARVNSVVKRGLLTTLA